jgi:hypothetical protein
VFDDVSTLVDVLFLKFELDLGGGGGTTYIFGDQSFS